MKPTFRVQEIESSPRSSATAMSPMSAMTALTPISPFTFIYLQNFPSFQSFSKLAEQETKKADEVKPVPIKCGCRRTKCLKLYCDCFASGKDCSEDCECKGCHNNEDHKEEKEEVKLKTKSKNPAAFRDDISNNYKICHCSKSHCNKRYCECFQSGRSCGPNCRCKHCKNMPNGDRTV